MKYRIVKEDGLYWPERKWLFFWNKIKASKWRDVSFLSFENATLFLDIRTKKVKKQKEIYPYPVPKESPQK